MTAPDKLEPSEWKWVPKYPDDAMFNAGVVVCRKKTVGSIRRAQAVWDAMYSAAPPPPSPPTPAMGEWNLDAVMNAVRHYGTTMTNAEILICMGDTLPPPPEKL